MKVFYRWLDYYGKRYCETECEVISDNGKTAMIRLKGYARNNTPPGTEMRVHLKSLVGYPPVPEATAGGEMWKRYCYFD